nr:MAG TPA: RNA dependent RNA polymerase [Caudoviricetes sp.]
MLIISKQQVCQKYIYKIHSSRLRKERWSLTLPLEEARRNDEVISLADSNVLRWIDQFNGITDADMQARNIKTEIRRLRKEPNSIQNKRKIKQLYTQLDQLQYKKDYMCLIIDKEKDYYRACKGFSINGVRYKRLLGSNGGIKNNTIIFVSESLSDELNRRIDNGRNPDKKLVTAKLEAYKALTCSASTPVSFPKGIIVVNDCITKFISDTVYLTDEDCEEPYMEERKSQKIEMNASDGFGLMSPSLARRWSAELRLDYTLAGANTRFSFEKGMVFTFDYIDFGEKEAHGNYLVKDAWGDVVDIRNVELILTTSMVKLWDSYSSCQDYISKSLENGYTFGITKTCPKHLENERTLNYQFIQSYDLSNDDIEELIEPTMSEIKDVLGGDWRKTVLFMKGSGLSEDNICSQDNDAIKALMIDRGMMKDPFVQSTVYQAIRNRINRAKVGALKVHGNYSMVSGDPYALCQSIFGLEVTGLLKAGEIYNKYWLDSGSKTLACFRAPMTCHNNIRKVSVYNSSKTLYWYRYMNTCTIFNAWDTSTAALNGMDYDGDLVMLTDNKVLVEKLREMPALMCAQRKAEKKVSTEEDFIRSNIESFGNDIGKTTNWITSMFEVRSRFPKGSMEYKELSYRIKCGQLYQQNAIDKAKGIICKPMPRTWHDRHSVNKIENNSTRNFYRSIVADKKPYFMRYIYPALMRQYNTYIKNTNRNSLREFQLTIDELMQIPPEKLTNKQVEFLKYYRRRMPVGTGDCIMNRICRRFEEEFDGYMRRHNKTTIFDYSIMKSGVEYSSTRYHLIKKLYEDYTKRLQSYIVFADYERVDECESSAEISNINEWFRKECIIACQNSDVLCDILLDICYTRSATKKFAWDMCGETIIHNLLKNNDYTISFPVVDKSGDIKYCGERYTVKTKKVEVRL